MAYSTGPVPAIFGGAPVQEFRLAGEPLSLAVIGSDVYLVEDGSVSTHNDMGRRPWMGTVVALRGAGTEADPTMAQVSLERVSRDREWTLRVMDGTPFGPSRSGSREFGYVETKKAALMLRRTSWERILQDDE